MDLGLVWILWIRIRMERVPDRILITGYIGFGNAGDEAIAQVVTGHLRELVPGVEITMVSGNPAQTAEAYGVRAIGWRDPLAIAEAVRTTDLTILGGGGLFQDYWGFEPNAILTREHWGLSFYVAPALLAAVYAKPLMLYAVGAGPLLSEHGRKYTKVAGDIATRITVRDLVTKDLFESLGVSAHKIALTADPAFDLAPAPEAADLPEVREWKSHGPAIAVCLRNWRFGTDQTFCERQIAAALDDLLESEGGRLLFLPFHLDPGNDDDLAVAKRTIARLRHGQNAAVLTRPCSPSMLAGIVANAGLVLGMRLHSVIFSLAASVPFVALEYDPKIGAATALTGFEEFTIPLGGIESDMLAARMRQALHGRERFRELAGTRGNALRSRARENAVIAASLLHQGPAATDYGADARLLIGRLVMAQVAGSEGLIERLQVCCEELEQPVAQLRPFEMADGLVRKVKDLRIRKDETRRQLDEVQEHLASSRRELENAGAAQSRLERESLRTARQLEDAAATQQRLETENQRTARDLDLARARQQQADSQLAALVNAAQVLEARLAPLESKTLAGIAKRALQVVLDLFQILTPPPLRAAVRKHYLNWFYFRIYPEKRVRAAQAEDASPSRDRNPNPESDPKAPAGSIR